MVVLMRAVGLPQVRAGEADGVQAPGGADAHPPRGFLLDFHAPS